MGIQENVVEQATENILTVLGGNQSLRCVVCGKTRELSRNDVAKFLTDSWPTHHGQSMILEANHV